MEMLQFLPMKTGAGVVGFVGFERRQSRSWPEGTRSTLRAFVDGLTGVMELALVEGILREGQARYRLLADENPSGIIELDTDGVCRYANPAYARMVGREPEDLIGQSELSTIHPLDRDATRERLQTILSLGRAVTAEVRMMHADGHSVWAEVNGIRINDIHGNAAGILKTAVDISARRAAQDLLEQSERRFRGLVQHASDIFTVLEADGGWRYSSPAGTHRLGWVEGSEPPGGILTLVHPDDAALAASAFGEVVAGVRGPDEPVSFRVRAADGEYRVFETSGQNLLDDPAVRGILLISRDVTEREQVQNEIAAARDAALAALRARNEFIAVVSHELRTPMHAVLGLSELLSTSVLDPEQRQFVESIRRSVQSLSAVVDDILDYSRAEAGRLELRNTDFNLASVIGDVVTLLSPDAADKGLLLTSTIASTVPFLMHGDPDRIRQLLTNLVANAVKFTDHGSVTVTADVVERRDQHLVVRLVVRDTGVGIARDAAERLFEPFSQGEAAMRRRYGGTGLGLAICRQLVGLMNGTLTVESEPGAGSEFIATVVLRSADRPRMSVRVTVPSAPVASMRQRRVLVVEDNEVNQLLAERQLAELNLESSVV
ncbi:MAG: PAS domain S-box protein, partial [Acidimicrobiia bacterium]